MKLTIARKFGLAIIIMTGMVIAYSLYANVCMWSLRKSMNAITNESVPLVIAAEEMDRYKTAGRAELKTYLMENNPDKLPAIEKKIHALISEHDHYEIEIGKILDSLCHGHGDESGEMRKIWDEGMATVMPEFDQKLAETIDAHKHYLKSQMVRIAKMEEHEEYGIKLFKLLTEMHNNNQDGKVVMSAVMDLKTAHLDMMNADEEYMTKGGMVTRKERLGFKKEFVEHSEVFGKWLKALQDAVGGAKNQALISKISQTYKKFVTSALEQEQLFNLYENELFVHAKRLDNLASIDELSHLDSKMAQKLIRLAKEHLRDVESRAGRLVKLTSVVFVMISVIVIFGCWFVAKIISRKIVKPILVLSDAAGIIAKGDLSKRVEVFGNDEIGQLCDAFNKMAENLSTTTTSIDNLNAVNQQLSVNEQQLRTANQQLESEIAERRKAEETLQVSRRELNKQYKFLRSVLESLTHPFYVIDANDYTIKIANSAASTEKLPKNATCYAVSHRRDKPCDGADDPCPLEEVKKTKKPVEVEHTHYDKDGNLRKVEVHAYPIFDREGNVCQIIESSLDITERKQVEESLKHAYKELENANSKLKNVQSQMVQSEKMASIGQLAAGVAHEMNTPVGFVASNFQTLKSYVKKIQNMFAIYGNIIKEVGTSENMDIINKAREDMKLDFILEDIQGLFSDSEEGLERVTNIVQNLRDFSRIDQSGSLAEYSINEGIKSTLVVAKNEIKYDCDVLTDYSEVPFVLCNPGQINQVFLNILVNSAQAIRSQEQREGNGTIKIRTYADDKEVVCEISDNGIGIPKDKLTRVFDPFFTTKPAGKGTGLGLSVSYDIIVNKHKGKLLVDSTVGKGAKFTIKLPIKTQEILDEKGITNDGKEECIVCG